MDTNRVPSQDMSTSETGCCPKFDPAPWDDQELHFRDKLFVKGKTVQFLHMPLNMKGMMARVWKKIRAAGADPADEFLVLSCDPSPWRGEHYFAVTKEVPGLDNVKLSGDFVTKIFEGPFRDAGKWAREAGEFAASKGRQMNRLFFYYTTCPGCAEHYGKNYVVALAQV
jgi:hypothetical protein